MPSSISPSFISTLPKSSDFIHTPLIYKWYYNAFGQYGKFYFINKTSLLNTTFCKDFLILSHIIVKILGALPLNKTPNIQDFLKKSFTRRLFILFYLLGLNSLKE